MDKSTDALLNLFKKINFTSQYHKINKLNILKGLINLNRDLAPQGSVEWLNSRLYNIGGSEMSVITGDYYRDVEKNNNSDDDTDSADDTE